MTTAPRSSASNEIRVSLMSPSQATPLRPRDSLLVHHPHHSARSQVFRRRRLRWRLKPSSATSSRRARVDRPPTCRQRAPQRSSSFRTSSRAHYGVPCPTPSSRVRPVPATHSRPRGTMRLERRPATERDSHITAIRYMASRHQRLGRLFLPQLLPSLPRIIPDASRTSRQSKIIIYQRLHRCLTVTLMQTITVFRQRQAPFGAVRQTPLTRLVSDCRVPLTLLLPLRLMSAVAFIRQCILLVMFHCPQLRRWADLSDRNHIRYRDSVCSSSSSSSRSKIYRNIWRPTSATEISTCLIRIPGKCP
jgi:hypothetical protein